MGNDNVQRTACLLATLTLLAVTSNLVAQRDPIRLSHGPMLGQPTAHSMLVWARTSDPGEFRVAYGTSATNMDKRSDATTTTLDHDNTGVA